MKNLKNCLLIVFSVMAGISMLLLLAQAAPKNQKTASPAPSFSACATDTMDQLPIGLPFKSSPSLLQDAQCEVDQCTDACVALRVARCERSCQKNCGLQIAEICESKKKPQTDRQRFDAWRDHSQYSEVDLPIVPLKVTCEEGSQTPRVSMRRIEFANGSAVGINCNLHTTPDSLRSPSIWDGKDPVFTIKKVTMKTKKYLAPLPPGRLFTYELQSPSAVLKVLLTCEVTPERIDQNHPYATFDQTLLNLGELEDAVFERFPMQIRTETDPAQCTALHKLNPPQGDANPSENSNPSKPPYPPGGEPPAEARPAGGATRASDPSH